MYLDTGADSSEVFFHSDVAEYTEPPWLATACFNKRSTRSFGRGARDQTKVDARFTRSVERDNLMKSSASSSDENAIWDERQECRPKKNCVDVVFFIEILILCFCFCFTFGFTLFLGLAWKVNTDQIFTAFFRRGRNRGENLEFHPAATILTALGRMHSQIFISVSGCRFLGAI